MEMRISIPYGAIKSLINIRKIAGSQVISIPYGAIKRWILGGFVRPAQGFQFLMVRLKVIKKIIKDYEIFKFQFLMVRLKVTGEFNCPNLQEVFQFLMVRLKVVL